MLCLRALVDLGFAKGGGMDHGQREARVCNGGPGRAGRAPSGSTGRAWKLFVHFHTKERPKVKDLNEMIQIHIRNR